MVNNTLGKIRTINYKNGNLHLIDQTLLPDNLKIRSYSNPTKIAEAITTMVVRGAPAIGVTAALGIAIGLNNTRIKKKEIFLELLKT